MCMFPIFRKHYVLICNKDGCFVTFQSESAIKIKAVPNLTALNFAATVLNLSKFIVSVVENVSKLSKTSSSEKKARI